MSFTEVPMAVGRWDVQLDGVPKAVRRAIDVRTAGFSQIVITPTHVDPTAMGDAGMLASSRYTGVYRASRAHGTQLSGPGLLALLGDEEGKGDVLERRITTANGWLSQWYAELKLWPNGIADGMIVAPGGRPGYTGGFQYVNRRQAWDELVAWFGVEYRIRHNLMFDVAPEASLYGTVPRVVVLGAGSPVGGGRDINLTGVRGTADLSVDLEDYTAKVIYRTGQDPNVPPFIAGSESPTYRTPSGSPLVMDRLIEAFGKDGPTPSDMAAAQLGRFDKPRMEWRVAGSGTYDIGRDCPVGSPIWLYSPDDGLIDLSNPVAYRGTQIYPTASRLMKLETPIRAGSGVYLRSAAPGGAASYLDLTPYVEWEQGEQSLTLGSVPRSSR